MSHLHATFTPPSHHLDTTATTALCHYPVRLECESYKYTALGLCTLTVAWTVVVHRFGSRFAWVEADKPVMVAARALTVPGDHKLNKQPIFCFETMLHMLYWSSIVYDYKRVCCCDSRTKHDCDVSLCNGLELLCLLYHVQRLLFYLPWHHLACHLQPLISNSSTQGNQQLCCSWMQNQTPLLTQEHPPKVCSSMLVMNDEPLLM